ncbi:MAG: ATP-binding cassette domain-containing protein, partial [Muribaculaceae bacterium]|nr:ATP-binding cassette domain-containing protein [Muribaculaceae bacterium]
VKAYSPFYPNFSEESLNEALSHFNLSPDIHLGALSMGQRKKAFLAFALACHTPVLLMDEPTNGLDIPGKSEFRKAVVKTMNDERTIIISTHQVRDLDQLLDHVTIMDNNGIQLDESVSALQEKFVFGLSPMLPETGVIWSEQIMGGYAYMKMRTPDQPETEVNLEALFNYIYSKNKNHQ